MASRLASFNAPSTPTQSPVRAGTGNSNSTGNASPANVSASSEGTVHRRVRALLVDLATATHTWTDLVLHDGLRAAKAIVDARTQLDNALVATPLPRHRFLTPNILAMDASAADLRAILAKLKKQFNKMVQVADSLDALVTDTHKQRGWSFVATEPLWATWPLILFAERVPALLPYYDRALRSHIHLAAVLEDYATPFDAARSALAQWIAQEDLNECPWPDFDDLFGAGEVDRWPSRK